MTGASVDREKLRLAIRRLNRGNLLLIAERAIGLVSSSKLRQLLGDIVKLDAVTAAPRASSLLAEVQKFHAASLRGDYYESFMVNSRNFSQTSEGTDAFSADLDRLLAKCVRAAAKGPHAPIREAFDLLFALLRRIDEGSDDVVFFADEGGVWQFGIDWKAVLPACFRSLAATAPAEEFAREVDRTIKDFAEYDRPRFLAAARRVATAEQKAALRKLPVRERRR